MAHLEVMTAALSAIALVFLLACAVTFTTLFAE
jgi:hypothetical protein